MEPARWSVWDLPAALVPMNYIEQVQAAGAAAVLIPPDPALVDDPGRVLDRLDGLLLVGGADVAAELDAKLHLEAGVYRWQFTVVVPTREYKPRRRRPETADSGADRR